MVRKQLSRLWQVHLFSHDRIKGSENAVLQRNGRSLLLHRHGYTNKRATLLPGVKAWLVCTKIEINIGL